MKIPELDNELKEIIDKYSVYGAECIINSLVRVSKGKQYINESLLKALIHSSYTFEMIVDGTLDIE